ncbi:hypothetical protein A0H76_1674 [Hepatospora eriocheir]|uniref:Uncharacterized protein n=2 Tax=Hepatospora eriocheir TaxID=1081669 RepID=A0A1X0QGQ4_9MICR|nr:hypothetical protein A0H76_1674 [Hepatospora eriocheir]
MNIFWIISLLSINEVKSLGQSVFDKIFKKKNKESMIKEMNSEIVKFDKEFSKIPIYNDLLFKFLFKSPIHYLNIDFERIYRRKFERDFDFERDFEGYFDIDLKFDFNENDKFSLKFTNKQKEIADQLIIFYRNTDNKSLELKSSQYFIELPKYLSSDKNEFEVTVKTEEGRIDFILFNEYRDFLILLIDYLKKYKSKYKNDLIKNFSQLKNKYKCDNDTTDDAYIKLNNVYYYIHKIELIEKIVSSKFYNILDEAIILKNNIDELRTQSRKLNFDNLKSILEKVKIKFNDDYLKKLYDDTMINLFKYFYVLKTNNDLDRFEFLNIKEKIKQYSKELVKNYDDSEIDSELKDIKELQEQNKSNPLFLKRQIDLENRLYNRLMRNLKFLNLALGDRFYIETQYIECFRSFLKNFRAFAVRLY